MPYNTRRSLDERSFLRSRRHRRRPSPTKYPAPCSPAALTKYFVLRPHTLPSALFLPAASCPIQVLALTSSFVPRSHQFIWLTNISPTSYDALRSHSRTADADPNHDCRAKQMTMASAKRAKSCCYPYVSHLLLLYYISELKSSHFIKQTTHTK